MGYSVVFTCLLNVLRLPVTGFCTVYILKILSSTLIYETVIFPPDWKPIFYSKAGHRLLANFSWPPSITEAFDSFVNSPAFCTLVAISNNPLFSIKKKEKIPPGLFHYFPLTAFPQGQLYSVYS